MGWHGVQCGAERPGLHAGRRQCWEDFGFRQVGKMKNRSLREDTGDKNKVLGANHLETGSGAVGLSRALEEPRWVLSEGQWLRSGSSRKSKEPGEAQDPDGASHPGPGRWWGKRMGQAVKKKSERKGGEGLRKEPGAASHHLP